MPLRMPLDFAGPAAEERRERGRCLAIAARRPGVAVQQPHARTQACRMGLVGLAEVLAVSTAVLVPLVLPGRVMRGRDDCW